MTNLHFHWQKRGCPDIREKGLGTNFIPIHRATTNTSSIIPSYRWEKLVRPQVQRSTRPSKPISSKTVPISTFYTSERNDGHEGGSCRNGDYTPGDVHPPTGKELWRKWKFEYTGNARIPYWIVRVPKDIIWGHGGLWSDNSIAMLGALFHIDFPLAGGKVTIPKSITAPKAPDLQQLNRDKHASQHGALPFTSCAEAAHRA